MSRPKRPGIHYSKISVAGGLIEYRYFVRPKGLDGKDKTLGRYETFEEASKVLDAFEKDGTKPAKKKTGPKKRA